MTTITKEWLQQTIAEFENTRDDIPFGLSDDDAKILLVLKRALASFEAEPIGAFHIADQQVGGTSDYIKDGEWPIDNGVIEVYAAPPATVVPEEIPKGLAGQIVSLLVHNIGDKFLAQKIWNACRAAMLQGGQPVSNRDELQVIGWLRSDYNSDDKRDPNAPLFMLGRNDPSETWGVKYIPLSGNSPVIPGGWISCSERMPEDEQEVIVHNKLGYRYVSYFDEHSGLFFDMRGGNQMNCIEHILVTHWMPLQAAPQQ